MAHGHRNIAFYGADPAIWTARQRRDAFVAAHEGLGLPSSPRVSMGPHTAASVQETLTQRSRGPEPITAVAMGNSRITIAALLALRELRLPLALLGFDDFELAALIDPPVTVVHQDPAAMGQRAAQQLFARLLGDESPAQTFAMPTRLIVRASGLRRATPQR